MTILAWKAGLRSRTVPGQAQAKPPTAPVSCIHECDILGVPAWSARDTLVA